MNCKGQIFIKTPNIAEYFSIPPNSYLYQVKNIECTFSIPYEESFLLDHLKCTCKLKIERNGGGDLLNAQLENLRTFFDEKSDPSFLERIFAEIFDDFEKQLNDFKSKNSSNKVDYILLKSKTIGVHDSVKTGTEWVEVNSNRMGLDFHTDTYDHFFTPEYQVINVFFMSEIPEIINQRCNMYINGYDWQCPYTIGDAMDVLRDMGLTIEKGKKLYIRELDRVRLNKDEKYYDLILNSYEDKKLSFKTIEYSEFEKVFVNKCQFSVY